MTKEQELDSALSKAFAAAAFYRDAISQIRELTKGQNTDMYSVRRSCSEALDAVDVGGQFMEILLRLQTENSAFREMFGSVNTQEETESIVH